MCVCYYNLLFLTKTSIWFLLTQTVFPDAFSRVYLQTELITLFWWTVVVVYKAHGAFLSKRCHVNSCILPVHTSSMLTFKLLPCCEPRDEQKCHLVMTNKQSLHPILIPLFNGQKKKRWKRPICIFEKCGLEKPPAHTNNCRCDAWKCDIVPQIKVNPSKATRFFPPLSLSVNSLSHAHT